MSYDDFVSTFSYGFDLILSNFINLCNSLMSNYIFLTFLGLTLAIPFFWFLYNFIFHDLFDKEVDDLIDHYDRYERYKEFRHIRNEFNSNNVDFNEQEAIDSLQIKGSAMRHVNGGSLYPVSPIPVWLTNPPQSNLPSKEEKQEMDNIINNF